MSNLPLRKIEKNSDEDTRLFFDRYYTKTINLKDNDLSSVVGFFESKGFDTTSAIAVGVVILTQAKKDDVKIFQLLDTLKSTSDLKLSATVANILNYNRARSSKIGFKKEATLSKIEQRNIIDGTTPPVSINTATSSNFSNTGFTMDSDTTTWDGES